MTEVVQENVPEVVQENVPEVVVENVPEVVVENVPEVENKTEMPKKKEEGAKGSADRRSPPTITNPEPVENTPKVNKKLSTMSKNTKEKQKNRKLPKPTVSRAPPSMSLDINPMYLFGLLGVIIAAASLWYQRKSFLKEQGDERSGDDTPVQSTGGESEAKKSSPPKKTAKRQPFDPWEWKREHQQTGVGPLGTDASFGRFPGNYDFD